MPDEYITKAAAVEACCGGCNPALCSTPCDEVAAIRSIPAADVREVKRGKWEYTKINYDDYAWVCSVCGETWVLNDGTPAENNMNYCPNCGARMVNDDV